MACELCGGADAVRTEHARLPLREVLREPVPHGCLHQEAVRLDASRRDLGVYVDVVTWDGLNAAVVGAEKAMQSADCAAFFGMIVTRSCSQGLLPPCRAAARAPDRSMAC